MRTRIAANINQASQYVCVQQNKSMQHRNKNTYSSKNLSGIAKHMRLAAKVDQTSQCVHVQQHKLIRHRNMYAYSGKASRFLVRGDLRPKEMDFILGRCAQVCAQVACKQFDGKVARPSLGHFSIFLEWQMSRHSPLGVRHGRLLHDDSRQQSVITRKSS